MKKNLTEKISGEKGLASPFRMVDSEKNELEEIIEGCRRYDPNSQEKMYKKFYGYALGVTLTYCSSRADANEVVNDSFMKVFKNITKYNISRPFKPWLRRIIVNTSIDRARANRRFNDQIELDEIQPEAAADVEADLHVKQIYKLLNELPDLLRFVFNLYEIEGYSHREVAEKLNIAESSSRTYLTRAKAQLRQLYKNLFMEAE